MYYIGVTDPRWHEFLTLHGTPATANFWTPTLWRPAALEPGARWLFMLKSPIRKIGGFGLIAGYAEHTVEKAWELFGLGNGVASPEELRQRVDSFAAARSVRPRASNDPIGCILLSDVTLFGPGQQLTADELGVDFAVNIVKYKSYRGEIEIPGYDVRSPDNFQLVPGARSSGQAGTVYLRPDQARFRSTVMHAYERRCAISGVACSEVLDAAHIQPYVSEASHHVQNGLLLRKDLHALFDAGLIAFADDYTTLVSPVLAETSYSKLAGRRARLPKLKSDWPSIDAIRFQRQIFRG